MWPNHEAPAHEGKTHTYYWVSCTAEEAKEILAENRFNPADFNFYLRRIAEVEEINPQARDNFEDIVDQLNNTVGFLISSSGKYIEQAVPMLPVGGQWNAYNPFYEFETVHLGGLEDLDYANGELEAQYPAFVEKVTTSNIPNRVSLAGFSIQDLAMYVRNIPQTEQDGLNATDDELAMAIFWFQNFKKPPFHIEMQASNQTKEDLAFELGRQFRARGKLIWGDHEPAYPFKFKFFKAADMPLFEIYKRRKRANQNFRAVARLLRNEYDDVVIRSIFSKYSDDELCEMFFYSWFIQNMDFVKYFINEAHDRMGA